MPPNFTTRKKDMRVGVALLPSLSASIEGNVCIAIDALRATVTVTTLIDRGCKSVLPSRSVEEAQAIKLGLIGIYENVLLCGEDNIGDLSPGFDLPNSPTQLAKMNFDRPVVIMNSTSGTKLFFILARARSVLVGCPRNATACAQAAVEQAKILNCNIDIICAGSKGNAQITLEDAACAGLIVKQMSQFAQFELDDTGLIALELVDSSRYASNLKNIFIKSDTSKRLIQSGFSDDIDFCAQIDTTSVVPVMTHCKVSSEFLALEAIK